MGIFNTLRFSPKHLSQQRKEHHHHPLQRHTSSSSSSFFRSGRKHPHIKPSRTASSFTSSALNEVGSSELGADSQTGVAWGAAILQGHRPHQQDAFVTAEASGLAQTVLFGVFDGHGPQSNGSRASETAAKLLHQVIAKQFRQFTTTSSTSLNVADALRNSFVEFDEYLCLQNDNRVLKDGFVNRLIGMREDPGFHQAGTCAIIALVGPDKIYLANLGDSQAVCSGKGNLTRLHRTTEADEASRIYWAGGYIADGRVNGELVPTRSFGDFHFKDGTEPSKCIVTCVPEVIELARQEVGPYLVLASDGVFDMLTSAQVMEMCEQNTHQTPDVIAQRILDKAVKLGSGDNVTCIVIHLEPHVASSPPSEASVSSSTATSGRHSASIPSHASLLMTST